MVEAGCPVATSCGGCPLIAVSPTVAQELRETRLREALRKPLGDQASQVTIRWVSLPQHAGYRRRIRVRIAENAQIGFFNSNKYPSCPVLTEALRDQLARLRSSSEGHQAALAAIHHLELREPDLDGKASVYLVKHRLEQPLDASARSELDTWLQEMYWTVAGETGLVPQQRLALPGAWQFVPIGGFLQVNQAINHLLVSDLVLGARQRSLRTFCDLYAGAGNFTLPLLAAGLTGLSVELDRAAGSAMIQAAAAQQLQSLEVSIGDAGASAARVLSSGQVFDLVIVDPPRAGVRKELQAMAAITRSHLAYCSCNVESLARDLGALRAAHLELESITLYDMFQHTEHVETMVWLRAPRKVSR